MNVEYIQGYPPEKEYFNESGYLGKVISANFEESSREVILYQPITHSFHRASLVGNQTVANSLVFNLNVENEDYYHAVTLIKSMILERANYFGFSTEKFEETRREAQQALIIDLEDTLTRLDKKIPNYFSVKASLEEQLKHLLDEIY